MKKYVLLFTIAIIPLWLVAYLYTNKSVKIAPQFEEVVLKELGVTSLSNTLIGSIESLDLANEQLTSIEGIQYFTNLKQLNLRNNLLADATPLVELVNLETLDLRTNQLSKLALGSTKLTTIDVEGNKLTSLDFVEGLTELKSLNIRENYIVDLSPLEGLKKIEALNIRNNQVKTLDSLAHLNNLQDLNIRNNQISTIEPIVELPLEKRITIQGNEITDVHLLKEVIERTEETDIELLPPRPTALTQSGFYQNEIRLELRTAPKHRIFYTLDGSTPTIKSEQYAGPITLNEEVMLEQPLYANIPTSSTYESPEQEPENVKKAITVTAVSFIGGKYSKPTAFTYVFDDELPDSNLPIISLTVNPTALFDNEEGIYVPGDLFEEGYKGTGNYHMRGREFERDASLEYFDKDGNLSIKQQIGLRINGGYTRLYPQKSLRLYARADYGQSRFYSQFFEGLPYFEHDMLLLRNSGNDNNSTMLRDGLMHELVKDRKVDVQAYQPAIVLINGEYWGIHNLREKYNKEYIDIKYNIKQKELVMMTVKLAEDLRFDMDEGIPKDENHFQEVLEHARTNDLSEKENMALIEERVDLENFFEYVAMQVYYGNTDSFDNNVTMWRKKVNTQDDAPYGHDGRWRWMLFDLDWGMNYGLLNRSGDPLEFDMIEYMLRDHYSVEFFRELMENEDLKRQFTLQLLDLLENNFEQEHVQEKIEELASVIRPEMPRTVERWGRIESMEEWEQNIEEMKRFAEERPAIVKRHIKEHFNYTEEDLQSMEVDNRLWRDQYGGVN